LRLLPFCIALSTKYWKRRTVKKKAGKELNIVKLFSR
jgi:hypothetical protein